MKLEKENLALLKFLRVGYLTVFDVIQNYP
jgi:hypothetical protein